ncbi:Peptidase family M48 [Marivirga sericea]|uniref:Peptidase family M48 n=1 Tax=Marivirga sericea TaxID=1028 RepID=A0A1X7KL55_9BACT|nr:M48 family metalloprotease [Marivirga sericea]SMG42024.1 Peptidase family M48 [Marivirga sericea]
MKFTKINSPAKYIRYIFILSFSAFICIAQGQDLQSLHFSDSIISQIKSQHQERLNNYKLEDSDFSIYEKIYKIREKNIEKAFRDSSFVYDSLIYDCIDNCLQKFGTSNEVIDDKNYTILVSNSPIANAYSMGGGTIILTLGMLRKIRNQGALAFIIAHEIGHDYRQDVDISSYRTLERLDSKEFKNVIDLIDKEKYNRREQLETFLKTLYLTEMKFSRKQEISADSLALKLIINADYDHRYSFSTLNLLDSIDLYKFPAISYPNTLGFEDYPFKEKWILDKSDIFSMSAGPTEEDTDALKSHPDIAERIARLKLINDEKADTTNELFNQSKLLAFKSGIDLDLAFIDSWEAQNDFGKALFFSLKQLQEQPENKHLLTRISNLFDQIYEAQKSHELNKYVASPGPHQEASYKEFLTFLNRIRLSELEMLIYYFHLENCRFLSQDEAFLSTLNKYKLKTR